MNSYHSLLHDIYNKHVYATTGAAIDLFGKLIDNGSDAALAEMRQAIVFDLGQLDIYPRVQFDKFGFVELPYEKIWVEAVANENATFRIGAFVKREKHYEYGCEIEQHEWLLFALFNGDKHWSFHNAFVTRWSGTNVEMHGVIDDDEMPGEQYGAWISHIYAAFLAARCKNVEAIENTPSRLKRNRSNKKSKIPLFSDWTLHIILGDKQSTEHGGTHASPRIHLRRGHVREYKPGLFTWVQECVVGTGPGIVHKDYAVHAQR